MDNKVKVHPSGTFIFFKRGKNGGEIIKFNIVIVLIFENEYDNNNKKMKETALNFKIGAYR